MQKLYFFLGFLVFLTSCKNNNELHFDKLNINEQVEISYSKGFTINKYDDHQVITLNNPWPGSETVFRYALVEKGKTLPTSEKYDAIIEIPVKNIVVTSTTHIPSLEMLGVSDALVGFPNLNYVSSEKTRNRIDDGLIVELGKNEDINTEVLIDLSPDLVVGFAVDGNNSAFRTIQATGIPKPNNRRTLIPASSSRDEPGQRSKRHRKNS